MLVVVLVVASAAKLTNAIPRKTASAPTKYKRTITALEIHRKSLIQHCQQNQLYLHFERLLAPFSVIQRVLASFNVF